jgi:hypothetical protein
MAPNEETHMTTRSLHLRFIILTALLLSLCGCASNQMYRSVYESCEYNLPSDCALNSIQHHGQGTDDAYRLGFIEYDDQGQLRDPAQMETLVDEYAATRGEILMITFVHGWHHSAQPQDKNIQSFRGLLKEISTNESAISKEQNRTARKILGVYIGWRGDSINLPFLKNVTFWGRKSVAHEVGRQGVTPTLLRFEEIVNVKRGIDSDDNPTTNSRLVVIGHSFGGALTFSSLHKVLADRFRDSRTGQTFSGDANGFGDLVVLVNPAFEALRYASLFEMTQESCRGYFTSQVPRLAVLTSEADNATKYAFPAGRVFTTLTESHVTLTRHDCQGRGRNGKVVTRIDEAKADRTTIGHFEPYLTHRLNPGAPAAADRSLLQIQQDWAEHDNDKPVAFNGSQLKSLDRTTPLNPYLNIQVDKALISNHNDIWGDGIRAFLSDLILISTTP